MSQKHSHTYNHKPPPDTAQGGFGFIPNGIREKNIFFYHPDHLGSSSYITGQDGKVSQHTEYIAFGEILFDEHNTEHTMPYLFNGKELDSETGLYYYGARYYDPKVSIFVNVDPLVEKTMQSYAYANNNPINLIDPTGMEGEEPKYSNPDSFFHKLFWSKARRNAYRAANSKANIGYESDIYKNSNLWSIKGQRTRDDGNTITTNYFAASYDDNGEVYSKNWNLKLESVESMPIQNTIGNTTINSPNPLQGKSHFDIVMVDTNPVMLPIAGAVAPPLGFLSGGIQSISDFYEGNFIGGTIGLLTFKSSGKMSGDSYQWLRKGPTYSQSMKMKTIGYRWGASEKYLYKVPHPMMLKFNQYLRHKKLPFGNKLQRADPGHYHLKPNF